MTSMAYVGMDVHKETTRLVVLPADAAEPVDECTVATTQQALRYYLRRWGEQYELHCVYEASGCGYVPHRWLTAAGIACTVIAPSKTPRGPGDRVKTDRRDARLLARQSRAGALAAVQVPTRKQEAVRSVLRCREVRQGDVLAAKHRVLKLLYSRGEIYTQGTHWTQQHRRWLRSRTLDGLDQWTVQEYLTDLEYREQRLAEANTQIAQLAGEADYQRMVGWLCCFRGIDVLSAMTLLAETIDFHRFGGAGEYMSYQGLVPSEDSSASQRRQGSITKSGGRHARRILVEAAWHYRHPPKVSQALRKRQAGQPPEVIAHAWKAQKRLSKTYWRIANKRDSRIAVIAVARELAGFIWAVMTEQTHR